MAEEGILQFALVAFTTLLVVVDPLGVLPIFVALTAGRGRDAGRAIVRRAVLVAFGVAMLFLVAGHRALAYLGVSVHAFAISGGILLFATAVPMLFGQRPAMQRSEPDEAGGADVAIFPLAIPLLAGPGTMTTILLLTARGHGEPLRLAVVALAIAVVFAIAWLVLAAGRRLLRAIGDLGVHVATRVLGILLAALAVQFVLNGVGDYVASLELTAR